MSSVNELCFRVSRFALIFVLILMEAIELHGSSPRFAYVTNQNDGTVSVYAVDAATGQLRPQGYHVPGAGARRVAIALNKFVYVVTSSSVITYSINSNGTLRRIASTATATGPFGMAIHPSGKFVYVSNQGSNNISAYAANTITGALTPLPGSPFAAGLAPKGLAISPTGQFLYAANGSSRDVSAYVINQTTGALIPIGRFTAAGSPTALLVAKSGKFLYFAGGSGGAILAYRISSSGKLTLIQSFTVLGSPMALTADQSGKFVYVGAASTDRIHEFSIDNTTGALISLPSGSVAAAVSSLRDVVVEPSNHFLFVSGIGSRAVQAFRIASDGELTPISRYKVRTRGQGVSLAISAGASPLIFSSKFAFVAAEGLARILVFSLGSTGTLQSLSQPELDGHPFSIAVDPFNRFVYTANASFGVGDGSNSISAFLLNGATGALTPVSGSPFLTSSAVDSVVMDPSGRLLYVLLGDSNLLVTYRVGTDGRLTRISSVAIAGAGTLVMDPIGRYLFLASSSTVKTFSINATSGMLTLTHSLAAGGAVNVDPTGKFLYLQQNGQRIATYSVDPATGLLTLAGSLSVQGDALGEMALHPGSRFLYASQCFLFPCSQILGFTVGSVSGKLTPIAGSPFSAGIDSQETSAMAADFSGRFLIATWPFDGELPGGNASFSINQSDGALTLLDTLTQGPQGIEPTVAVTRNIR